MSQCARYPQRRRGDPSPDGMGHLELCRGIEVGHIFQLRTKYSEALNATFLDEGGRAQIMEMGCYGIGVSRIVAAAIEQNYDERGIMLPAAMAPFTVAVAPIGYKKSAAVREAADKLYTELVAGGIEVLLDDRDERPGVMFADLELIGIPHRIVIGERGLKDGMVEYKGRRDADAQQVSLQDLLNSYNRSYAAEPTSYFSSSALPLLVAGWCSPARLMPERRRKSAFGQRARRVATCGVGSRDDQAGVRLAERGRLLARRNVAPGGEAHAGRGVAHGFSQDRALRGDTRWAGSGTGAGADRSGKRFQEICRVGRGRARLHAGDAVWVRDIGTSGQNLFHLSTNLRYGCTILRYYLDVENGDLYRALGRYNGSLGRPEYPNMVRAAWRKYSNINRRTADSGSRHNG